MCLPHYGVVISFGSDNHSGVHPDVMAALAEANTEHASAYGDDPWTRRAEDALREVFGPDTVPVLVANGTGANLIALQACLTRPWDAVVCSQVAHINVDAVSYTHLSRLQHDAAPAQVQVHPGETRTPGSDPTRFKRSQVAVPLPP